MAPKKTKAREPMGVRIASGDAVSLPVSPPVQSVSVGVNETRRRPARNERQVRAIRAGEESTLFAHGGEGFEAFCRAKGINPRQRRPVSAWTDLLDEFNSRPIHGHRRGSEGGSHRPNARSLRR